MLNKINKIHEKKRPGIYNCLRYEYNDYLITIYKTPEDISINIYDKGDPKGVLFPKGYVYKSLKNPEFSEPACSIDLYFINTVLKEDIDKFCEAIKNIKEIFSYTDFFINEIEMLGEV